MEYNSAGDGTPVAEPDFRAVFGANVAFGPKQEPELW